MPVRYSWWPRPAALGIALVLACSIAQAREAAGQMLPTGQWLTPTAAPGARFTTLNPGLPGNPAFVVGQIVSEALSPDRSTLLVLTSGYNQNADEHGTVIPGQSTEYVFVFDVGGGSAVQKQVLKVPNTYLGIAFAPSGRRFVVSGGGDDSLHVFDRAAKEWTENAASPVKLGHAAGIGLAQTPMAQGVAVTADGALAVVANRYNASVSVVNLAAAALVGDIELRPGVVDPGKAGTPGGEYPNSVSLAGDTAYVSSERDREIVVVDLPRATVKARIAVGGNPNKMILDRSGQRLFVAVDNADVVAVVDTASNTVVDSIPTLAPSGALRLSKQYRGASPNGLALSPDEQTLYVTNGGTNSVAVIDLGGRRPKVRGLIPTGWYPSDIVVGPHDALYIVNTQSVTGPNRGNCLGYQAVPCPAARSPVSFAPNQYVLNLSKGGFLSMPVPGDAALGRLTRRVARNNHFDAATRDSGLMEALRARIKHVIYIIKENRTYDQVLGDIGRGNSDAALAEFPYAITPNQHTLAQRFVLLDNFYDSGNVSGNGWPWSTAARESDAGAKMMPVNYANRGGSYDWEGSNSKVNVGLTGAARLAANPLTADPVTHATDPDKLPGTADIAAPDGPDGEVQQGYLWSAALRAKLTVRNYGCMIDVTRYSANVEKYYPQFYIRLDPDPYASRLTVAYAANPELSDRTDPYFRGFDMAFPDTYREREWAREFAGFVASGELPALTLVRFGGDHTGSFKSAIAGVNTPEPQVADNDFAVGRLIEAVAHSRYARDTLIFIVEDDAQDGPDHVDAHRSIAFVAGPYVKHGALVHRHYTTVNLLRTITDVLGLDHLGLFDATQRPMSNVFDLKQADWTYDAEVSSLLESTSLPIGGAAVAGAAQKPSHDANYWAKRTAGMDFDVEDKLDAVDYNRVLWKGLMGRKPYPARSGEDLTAKNAAMPGGSRP